MILYYAFARFVPSLIGQKSRRYLVRYLFSYLGDNVNIQAGVRFGRGALISIGANSGLGEGSYLVAMAALSIGRDVMIGPQVMMLTGGHAYDDVGLRLIDQKVITAPITIGDDVWIGARVIILPGVTIGNRVVIGAGSIVTRDIPSHSLCVGTPCSVIKSI